MSQTSSNSIATDNGPSASKKQKGDKVERHETTVELELDGMEPGSSNVSSMKQDRDGREQNETIDEVMELELDGMEQGPNSVSSKEQDPPDISI